MCTSVYGSLVHARYTDLFYSLPLLSVSCSFSQFAAPSEKLNFSEIAIISLAFGAH